MKYGIIEGFEMHRTKESFGLPSNGDRVGFISTAGELGFHGVEFGIGADFRQDPLWVGRGDDLHSIRNASRDTGVDVASVCLHMLNDRENSPASCDPGHRTNAQAIILNTIEACSKVGIPIILIPFFGSATLREKEQINHLVAEMQRLAPIAAAAGVCLALETSLGAPDMVRIIDAIGAENVKIYFDTGNADIIGYDVVAEVEELGSRIAQVHVKDNPSGILGQGNINFIAVLHALRKFEFDGYLVLETPALDNAIASASRNLGYKEGLKAALNLSV
jgi:sugar phosphate isomerase/epimerase